jgi:hypothetical protein
MKPDPVDAVQPIDASRWSRGARGCLAFGLIVFALGCAFVIGWGFGKDEKIAPVPSGEMRRDP